MTTRGKSFTGAAGMLGALGALVCLLTPLAAQTAATPSSPAAAPQATPSQPPAPSPLVRAAEAATAKPATTPVVTAVGKPAGTDKPATARPLLWKVEGAVPSYLYGTIHVPDQQVVQLPAAVEQAFGSAGAVFTEIPLDGATQIGVLGKLTLPGDQTLGDVLGAPLYARFADAVQRHLPKDAPPGTAAALTAMLGRLKPWAAMTQLATLEFLPDMMAGRKALDAMLYDRARREGKEAGALETIDEQLAVFEGFTTKEQVRMLELTLDSMDDAQRSGRSATRELIDGYLTGDLDKLSSMSTESMRGEPVLFGKFMTRALDDRNRRMVDRIVARRAERPAKVCFFAVGALHYAGDTGIIALLEKKGLKVTRVVP